MESPKYALVLHIVKIDEPTETVVRSRPVTYPVFQGENPDMECLKLHVSAWAQSCEQTMIQLKEITG